MAEHLNRITPNVRAVEDRQNKLRNEAGLSVWMHPYHFTAHEGMSMAEHAECWQAERGKLVPERDTPEWEQMYEEWIEFAFKDLHGK